VFCLAYSCRLGEEKFLVSNKREAKAEANMVRTATGESGGADGGFSGAGEPPPLLLPALLPPFLPPARHSGGGLPCSGGPRRAGPRRSTGTAASPPPAGDVAPSPPPASALVAGNRVPLPSRGAEAMDVARDRPPAAWLRRLSPRAQVARPAAGSGASRQQARAWPALLLLLPRTAEVVS
jgi:hypothetical protein